MLRLADSSVVGFEDAAAFGFGFFGESRLGDVSPAVLLLRDRDEDDDRDDEECAERDEAAEFDREYAGDVVVSAGGGLCEADAVTDFLLDVDVSFNASTSATVSSSSCTRFDSTPSSCESSGLRRSGDT